MENKGSEENFYYDDLSILQIQSENRTKHHARSKSSAEVHKYIEFKKTIKSTDVFVGKHSNGELKGGYAWHLDDGECVQHLVPYHRRRYSLTELNDEIVNFAMKTIKQGIDNTSEVALATYHALSQAEPMSILEEMIDQSREDVDMIVKYHASKIKKEIVKQLEEGLESTSVADQCIANLSDVDFNDSPYKRSMLNNPGQINNNSDDGESSTASVEKTFTKLQSKFNSFDNSADDDQNVEDVLKRIVYRCSKSAGKNLLDLTCKDHENRTMSLDDDELSDEVSLNSAH